MNVYTIIFNNASFLELQYLSFKKHCPLQSFTVIDNTNDATTRSGIAQFAAKYSCTVVPTTNPRFDFGGFSHQQAIQTALDNSKDTSIICDPDVFLLKPLELVNDFVLAGLMQGTEKIHYLWPGFLIINTTLLKDKLDLRGALINPSNLDDFIIPDPSQGWTWEQHPEQTKTRISTDSGGLLCRYIRDYSPKIHEFSLAFVEDLGYDSIIPGHLRGRYKEWFHYWVIGGRILHSGVSSNWIGRSQSEFEEKEALTKEIVEWVLKEA